MTDLAHLYLTTTDAKGFKTESFVKTVVVDSEAFDAVVRNYKNDWCDLNGYKNTATKYYALRSRKVVELTKQERRELERNHAALKAAGLLPNAFDAIRERLMS